MALQGPLLQLQDELVELDEEEEVEQVTCASDPQSQACQVYTSRRPAIKPTNNLYGRGSGWEVPRPFGGGWGDPHCKSIDGLEFECNFRGEAVWVGCEQWRVHAIAKQLGDANATVITKVAVRYGSETLVAKLNASVSMDVDNETGLAPTRYTLLLNGTEPTDDGSDGVEGTYLTATGFNNVLTIEDVDGNIVKASFLKDLIVLQVAPSGGCFNKTFGLSGNNNGNKSDDLTVSGTGKVLPESSSSPVIFEKFVKSHLINAESDSLFPVGDFEPVPVNDSFTPIFVDQINLTQCPAACSGNGACCLDASQGGEELVEAFTIAKQDIEETNSESVGFFANMRPAFEEAPSLFVLAPGMQGGRVQLRYVATDADGVSALSCDICPSVNASYAAAHEVTCGLVGLGTNSSSMVLDAKSLDYGSFSCFCEDAHGANTTIVTLILQIDTTTSVEIWAREEERNIWLASGESSTSSSTTSATSPSSAITTSSTKAPSKPSNSLASASSSSSSSASSSYSSLPVVVVVAVVVVALSSSLSSSLPSFACRAVFISSHSAGAQEGSGWAIMSQSP
eukprot:CAMPEP_0180694672 /NCGR_PEP_ID=MMETSP1038_2-20121128/2037_1 /TAXON_ID=632150 /ORGANISM="Azadinium spinosum, Strain 3D9" /LENGTH=565 /DNA_ID=CAMNT_0022726033 /DNA_START=48 /DNA_END=1744 /DNA_ORIENTATION=+